MFHAVHRTNIYLRDDQRAALRRRAQDGGVTASDVIREAVDAWLAEPGELRDAARWAAQAVVAERASQFPTSPAEWDRRPYFVHDYDVSWRRFREMVSGSAAEDRWWAMSRLLERAAWADIWRLTTVEALAADLPHLALRNWGMWDATIRQLRDAA
jgi:Arc/MetJ-type ribon-helix-helix transcriptional regulator